MKLRRCSIKKKEFKIHLHSESHPIISPPPRTTQEVYYSTRRLSELATQGQAAAICSALSIHSEKAPTSSENLEEEVAKLECVLSMARVEVRARAGSSAVLIKRFRHPNCRAAIQEARWSDIASCGNVEALCGLALGWLAQLDDVCLNIWEATTVVTVSFSHPFPYAATPPLTPFHPPSRPPLTCSR